MFELHETDEPVAEFDSKIWTSVIENVVVRHNGTLERVYSAFETGWRLKLDELL